MSDVDQTLEAQRDEINRLQLELAETRGRLVEARRGLRPKNEATLILPDGIQVSYANFAEFDAVFTMPIYTAGRYTLHDKAPAELGIERADEHGLILKQPKYDGNCGSAIAWLIQRVECPTTGVVIHMGRAGNALHAYAGRRLVDADNLVTPIPVQWGSAFRILAEVDRPVDLRVIISGLRRI